jgi:hypothetical protein
MLAEWAGQRSPYRLPSEAADYDYSLMMKSYALSNPQSGFRRMFWFANLGN